MRKFILAIFCASSVLFVSSCLPNIILSDADGNINEHDANQFNAVLSRRAVPMVWGEHYYIEPEDRIINGKSDTSASCRELLAANSNSLMEEKISDFPPQFQEPVAIDEIYFYTRLTYTPVYQERRIYEKMLGAEIEAELLNPGKIYMKDNFKYIGDINRGVHVYDYSNPEEPELVAFWYLPGNIDIAIKNNTMYANSYSNLAAINITNPRNPQTVKLLRRAFPNVYKHGYPMIDSTGGLLAAWVVDTVVECHSGVIYLDYRSEIMSISSGGVEDDSAVRSPNTKDTFGQGGSMSRFELSSDYLYAVDIYYLNLFDISRDDNPQDEGDIPVGSGLETIFKTDQALFMGSMFGMYIYDLKDPGNPTFASEYQHITSCDPVVVDKDMAYVTLRTGNTCRNGNNELDIIDVSDIYNPKLLFSYDMLNPHGLAVSDTLLFLCEGDHGLKVFSVKDPGNIALLDHEEGFHAFDVIVSGQEATVIGNNGVYQYDVSDPANLKLLSHTESAQEGGGFDTGGGIRPVVLVD
jgi:hypothetical protein